MGTAVGVDLGTSTSMIACHGGPGVPASEIPSVVAYLDGSAVVGAPARRRGAAGPGATIASAKRFLGRGYPAVAALVLRALADELTRRLAEPVTEVVITVPALYGNAQRRATREAARLAGLDVVRVLNESTAAALAHRFDRPGRSTAMVFDLGAGTLDVGVVDVGFGIVEVLAVAGDPDLGGDDFDRAIADHLAAEMARGPVGDPRDDPWTWRRLLAAAERAKVRLSSATTTRVSLPADTARRSGRGSLRLSRDAVEDVTAHLVERCRRTTERVLADAGVAPDDLDEVVLAGRAARMPAVRAMLAAYAPGRNSSALVDGTGLVARGAAIQAAALRGTVCDALVWDVTPADLFARTPDGRTAPIVRRNTATPVTHTVTVAAGRPGDAVTVIEARPDGPATTVGHVPLDQVPLDQVPLDQVPLDQVPLDQVPLDHVPLDQVPLDQVPLDQVPAGEVGLMFHVDADGILSASVRDAATGAERAVPILSGPPPVGGRDAELVLLGRAEL